MQQQGWKGERDTSERVPWLFFFHVRRALIFAMHTWNKIKRGILWLFPFQPKHEILQAAYREQLGIAPFMYYNSEIGLVARFETSNCCFDPEFTPTADHQIVQMREDPEHRMLAIMLFEVWRR